MQNEERINLQPQSSALDTICIFLSLVLLLYFSISKDTWRSFPLENLRILHVSVVPQWIQYTQYFLCRCNAKGD